MQRIIIRLMAVVLLMGVVAVHAGQKRTDTYRFSTIIDSTIANNPLHDTIGITTRLFQVTGLENATQVSGYVDLAAVYASSAADTAADTAAFLIYTGWRDFTPQRLIYSDSLFSGTTHNGPVYFDLSDTTLGDRISFYIISVMFDTAVANHGDTVIYEATIGVVAR